MQAISRKGCVYKQASACRCCNILHAIWWPRTIHLAELHLSLHKCYHVCGCGRNGTQPCGKSHCNPHPNDTRRIGTQQSGKYTSTRTLQHQRETMGNQPRVDFHMHTLALPKSVPSTITSQHYRVLAYLIKKSVTMFASCVPLSSCWLYSAPPFSGLQNEKENNTCPFLHTGQPGSPACAEQTLSK